MMASIPFHSLQIPLAPAPPDPAIEAVKILGFILRDFSPCNFSKGMQVY